MWFDTVVKCLTLQGRRYYYYPHIILGNYRLVHLGGTCKDPAEKWNHKFLFTNEAEFDYFGDYVVLSESTNVNSTKIYNRNVTNSGLVSVYYMWY